MVIDYSLYLITDRNLVGTKDFYRSVRDALRGGVSLLQVREKELSSRDFYNSARILKDMAAQYNVPLIVNDRLDIALAVDADGLHIGEHDLPLEIARKILGKEKILGYSVSSIEEARYAVENGANYLGAGAVFPTGSKADVGEVIGLEGLEEIKNAVKIPVVAIGGIAAQNVREVKKTGVDGISLISAILACEYPYRAAKELLALWRE